VKWEWCIRAAEEREKGKEKDYVKILVVASIVSKAGSGS